MQDLSPALNASANSRRNMVDCQIRTFDVTDLGVIDAFLAVPRERFLGSAGSLAYSDAPLSVSAAITSWVQMSSQIGTPSGTPRTTTGPGSGPAAKTRFSSNTP